MTTSYRLAYKLFRLRKDGTLGSLFVNREAVLPVGVWLDASDSHPHPGLAHRPGWHCCGEMRAPHIKLRLKNGEQRVWARVIMTPGARPDKRPASQGGLWWLATRIKILETLKEKGKRSMTTDKNIIQQRVEESLLRRQASLRLSPKDERRDEAGFLSGAACALQAVFGETDDTMTDYIPPLWVMAPMTGRQVKNFIKKEA